MTVVRQTAAETAAATGRRRASFHPLTVDEVRRLTDDAIEVTFGVPVELAGQGFGPGLHPQPADRDQRVQQNSDHHTREDSGSDEGRDPPYETDSRHDSRLGQIIPIHCRVRWWIING